jgi:type I restriction enzyme S subunit
MDGWTTVPMGELCSIRSGKSDTKDAVLDGPYAFFDRSKTIKKSSRFLFDCEALVIPGEGAEFLPRYFSGKFDLHQRAYALYDFSADVDVWFLYYYLHYSADYFPRVAVGATVKSLRRRHFEELPVLLTSRAEQRRIVAILDEAFEAIATAKANTEKSLWNARKVFASALAELFPSNTESVSLAELSVSISDGDHSPPPKAASGVPFITISNVCERLSRNAVFWLRGRGFRHWWCLDRDAFHADA